MLLEPKVIDRKIKMWAKKLNVDSFKIDFTISEDSSEDSIDNMAEIEISLAYNNAHIVFFAPAIRENQLDEVVIHELLHLVLEPLSSMLYQSMNKKFEKLVEDTVESTIERIIPVLLKK